ncbi:MAG: DUF928 domain-containing protein [Coleofasciculus sp. A1-SPW-01]|uniref:DUF928 domain-containing protein n=1 Tax=Coleofasciculus sp. A1-SPW-01 TaxID=3070819 RepID=UPI0033027F3D
MQKTKPFSFFFTFLFTLFLTLLLALPGVSAKEPPKPKPQLLQIDGIVAALDDGHDHVKLYALERLIEYNPLDLQAVVENPDYIAQKAANLLQDETVDIDVCRWAAGALTKGLEFKRRRSQEFRRRSGGVCGRCPCCKLINFTPLLPQLPTHNDEIPVELTVEANPTLLISVNKIESDETMASLLVNNAFFALLDEEHQRVIYETEISLKAKIPGLVSISLPETALTNPDSDKDLLEVDKTYHWHFGIPCDPYDWSSYPFAEGWVKRIAKEESLVQELAKTPEINHPKIYADYGIWTETVSSLVKLRERYPDNSQIQADWINLLASVGLAHLVAK